MSGKGVYYLINGCWGEGNFINNRQNGKFLYCSGEGRFDEYEFSDGELVE